MAPAVVLDPWPPTLETFFGWYLLDIVADTILFTWVYNNTRGSLLLALLFHTSIAVTGLFLTPAETTPLLGVALKWAVVAIVVATAGPAYLSRKTAAQRRSRSSPKEGDDP